MNLIFENHKKGNGGFISLKNESEEIGRLTYTIQPEKNTLIISYVMVFPKFEGQGMGKKLVEKGIEFSREKPMDYYSALFLCSFCNAENERYRRCISSIKKAAKFVVMVGRKFRPFFMLSFKNLVGISSSKND